MKRDILNSPRIQEIKKRRKKILIRKIYIFTIGMVIIFVALIFISRIDKLNIGDIQIYGNKITETEQIKNIASEVIAGKYLALFPKSNLFLYPSNEINSALATKFKRLNNINISIKDNKILEINVDERKAVYAWCGQDPLTQTMPENASSCYFTDDSGYIFDQAPYFSGDVYFKFYGQIDDAVNPAGQYFSPNNFSRLVSLKDMLEATHLKPVALYVVGDGDVKIYLSNESTSLMGPEILFKMDADFKKLVENLQSALATEPFYSDFKKKYSSLLYIDLRFGNKVYYKFK